MDKEIKALRTKDDCTEEDMVLMFELLTEQIKAGHDSLEKLRADALKIALRHGYRDECDAHRTQTFCMLQKR